MISSEVLCDMISGFVIRVPSYALDDTYISNPDAYYAVEVAVDAGEIDGANPIAVLTTNSTVSSSQVSAGKKALNKSHAKA